jgi:hypothetical protein
MGNDRLKKPVVELLAAQLHREYRAAEQAMARSQKTPAPDYRLPHDHGWICCSRQKYFLKRAAMLIKRSEVVNPETLGEAECALAATVLLRRLSVQGKLLVKRASDGWLPITWHAAPAEVADMVAQSLK